MKHDSSNNNFNQDMIVHRYNIPEARLESYLIPLSNQQAYEAARLKQDMNAFNKYGVRK